MPAIAGKELTKAKRDSMFAGHLTVNARLSVSMNPGVRFICNSFRDKHRVKL